MSFHRGVNIAGMTDNFFKRGGSIWPEYPGQYTPELVGQYGPEYTTVLGMTNEWGYVTYLLKISCKNGKYKYTLTNFYHSGSVKGTEASVGEISNTMELNGPISGKKKNVEQLKVTVDEHAKSIIRSLKKGMNNSQSTNNDW